MKKFLLIVIGCLFCISCGAKNDPEYKSRNNYIETTYLI